MGKPSAFASGTKKFPFLGWSCGKKMMKKKKVRGHDTVLPRSGWILSQHHRPCRRRKPPESPLGCLCRLLGCFLLQKLRVIAQKIPVCFSPSSVAPPGAFKVKLFAFKKSDFRLNWCSGAFCKSRRHLVNEKRHYRRVWNSPGLPWLSLWLFMRAWSLWGDGGVFSRLAESDNLLLWAERKPTSKTQATNQNAAKGSRSVTLTLTEYGHLVNSHGVVFIHLLGVRSHSWNQGTMRYTSLLRQY